MTTEHEHALELMPGYALGNLDTDENRLVERHAAACPACAQLLKQYQATVGDLPEAIMLYEPPADLRARILARAAAGESLSAGTANRSGVRTEPRRGKWDLTAFLPRLSPVWAAGLALIMLLALGNVVLWMRLDQARSTSALRTVALESSAAAPLAQGTLVISLDGEHGTLVVDGLQPLDPARQYQLWLVKETARASGGVFSVSKDGYGAVWIHAPDPLDSYQTVGITIEPAGGSPAPTGEKVLGGDL